MWVTAFSENADENSFADLNFPWRQPMGFGTLGTKLNPALSRIAVGEFSRNVHNMSMEALERGRRVSGRRLLYAIGHHFKLARLTGRCFVWHIS